MRTDMRSIVALVPTRSAIAEAMRLYEQWNGAVDFWTDFADYLRNGVVISTQDAFAMVKLVEVGVEHGWFVRVAVGDLCDLLRHIPFYLPLVAFCRRRDGRLRIYPTNRLIQLAKLTKKKG
jgi:hypothetical protein